MSLRSRSRLGSSRAVLDSWLTVSCGSANTVESCCIAWSVRSVCCVRYFFFFSSRRRHTRLQGDWSSDVCSSDLQRAVHLVLGVAEQTEAQDFLGHPRQGFFVVCRREAGQDDEPDADLSRDVAVHPHRGAGNTLEHDPHSTVTLLARLRG